VQEEELQQKIYAMLITNMPQQVQVIEIIFGWFWFLVMRLTVLRLAGSSCMRLTLGRLRMRLVALGYAINLD